MLTLRIAPALMLCLPFSAASMCLQTGPINGVRQCGGQSIEAAQQKLDAVYGALKNNLSKAGRKKLARAEDAWTQFRARDCEFEKTILASPPRASTSSHRACMLRYTKRRILELRRELSTTSSRDAGAPALANRVLITPRSPGPVRVAQSVRPLESARRIYFYTALAGLTPDQPHRYECRIRDAAGKLVTHQQKSLTTGTGRYREVCTANPRSGAYSPGQWRFEVFIDGRKYIDTNHPVHLH